MTSLLLDLLRLLPFFLGGHRQLALENFASRQFFRHRVKGMRITEALTAPHSPWQTLSPSA